MWLCEFGFIVSLFQVGKVINSKERKKKQTIAEKLAFYFLERYTAAHQKSYVEKASICNANVTLKKMFSWKCQKRTQKFEFVGKHEQATRQSEQE